MKKKKYNMQNSIKGTITVLLMALFLGGCGNAIPEMTAEEELAVSEYAAMLLLRYDANNRSRLVDLTQVEESTEEAVQPLGPESTAEPETTEPETTEPETTEPPESIPEVTNPTQTPVVDNTTDIGSENVGSMESFFALPEGVNVVYNGFQLYTSYPEESNDYFIIEAAEGNKLLVLKFLIENQSQNTQAIDLLAANAIYKVMVNGGEAQTAEMTMLMNDMSTYIGSVAAGQSEEVVLLVELEESVVGDIDSIALDIRNELSVCTISDLK